MFVFSAVLKVPRSRPETGTAHDSEDIDDDHILDKGFSESPSCLPSGLTYSDSDSAEYSSTGSLPSFSSFRKASEGMKWSPETAHASMCLSLPPEIREKVSTYTPTAQGNALSRSSSKRASPNLSPQRPLAPVFSIFIISEHPWSLHSISHHIRMTLPKTVPHHIELATSYSECLARLDKENSVYFTHLVINLPDHNEIIALLGHVQTSEAYQKTTFLVLTNPVQRTAILDGATECCNILDKRLRFIGKPIKPSRFGVFFDPDKERDASMDRHRDTAQQVVESQRRVFMEMEKDVGNKGHRVLLVEDNPVNQKVCR